MLGKVFWGMVILLFIAILVIPFILPSYYANQADAQYNNEQYYDENYESEGDDGDDIDIDFKKRRKKTSTGGFFSKSVRSSGGSRSFSSGK
ncbi:MAG: hypothetical protein SD837_20165 [Candidatus Electrothrix scaldis]|jgi:hypothetical protein|nr:MAG: hypothetical protein SD837_20165 [Candidatus Electrothrix sp. GW3-3]